MSDLSDCSDILKSLADKTRLRVVFSLLDGPLTAGKLQEILGLEQSLLSHHLYKLRRLNLVQTKKQGRVVYYSLADTVVIAESRSALNFGCCQLTFGDT